MIASATSWANFIGFLAGRDATIYAQIKDWAFDDWADRYKDATGEPVPADGHYQIVPPDMNKWACSASITFRASLGELISANGWSALPLDVAPREASNGRLVIYSERVMWDLFEYGFVLGPKQRPGRIRSRLADGFKATFDKGMGLAGTA